MSDPSPGDVIHLAYLWRREAEQGRTEGTKERPCVVVLVDRESTAGSRIVSVVPITHSLPRHPEGALELPPGTKRRLGLDEARSWIVTSELNRFTWPGYDLRRTPDGRERYGPLPYGQLRTLLKVIVEQARGGALATVDRDE